MVKRLGVGGNGAEAIEHLRRGIEIGEALRQVDGTILVGDARHAADDRIGKRRRAVGEFFHAYPFEHWVEQVYSYGTGGICSKRARKTLFKILEKWGLHRVAFLAIIVKREAHRTRWV